jgi:hypothetical protein
VEEFLIALLQGLAELALQILVEWPFDFTLGSGERRASLSDAEPSGFWWGVGSLVAGVVLALVSLIVVPHVLVPSAGIRIANLFVAPVASAWVAYRSAKLRQARNRPWLDPDLHGWCAFLFTAAFTTLRFMYARR